MFVVRSFINRKFNKHFNRQKIELMLMYLYLLYIMLHTVPLMLWYERGNGVSSFVSLSYNQTVAIPEFQLHET